MILIRQYGNRKLYDTSSHLYINYADMHDHIRNNRKITVYNVYKKKDITQGILLNMYLLLLKKKLGKNSVESLTDLIKSELGPSHSTVP